MAKKMFSIWAQQARAPFLILSVVLVLIGISAAFHQNVFNLFHSILLVLGVTLTHISVNLFNELSDYHSKIDENTQRTPFSGGSGMLQAKNTSPKVVRFASYLSFIISGGIGIYFAIISGWLIIPLMIMGGVAILFYTPFFSKWLLGEIISGLTLGSMVIIGVFYALTSTINLNIILISIPPGILTTLLLFLNEFPDLEADKAGGRHHLVIHFGRKISAIMYVVLLCIVYLIILVLPIFTNIPKTIWIALLTFPVAIKASFIILKNHSQIDKLIPAMGMNVIIVLVTDLLIAIGYFI